MWSASGGANAPKPTAPRVVGRAIEVPPNGGVYISRLARALARLPDRLEFDRDEAQRVVIDIAERWRDGDIARDDAIVFGGAPQHWRPFADFPEDVDNLWLWETAVALTEPAARRYVETCGLAGAQRVLREMFGAPVPAQTVAESAAPDLAAAKARPTPAELDQWMKDNVKSGSKRDLTIEDCHNKTGQLGDAPRPRGRASDKNSD
jgi:hypothetical protein